jgi:hypothetical protein
MINKSMKKYQDILSETSQAALDSLTHRQQISKIADILEASEKYLGRPLSESEIYSFTEILMEEEAPVSRKDEKQKGEGQTFKKGSYKIEIITPQGKVVRTASSQKGLLDVIHSAKNFRVLDSNNRDITSKVKTFVKEREKQAQLRKNLKKKGKVNEEFLAERIGGKQLAQLFLAAKLAFSPAAAMPAAKAAAPVVTQGVVQVEKAAVQAGTQATKTATQAATQTAKTTTQAATQTAKTATQTAAPQAAKATTQTAAPQAAKAAPKTAPKTAAPQTAKAVETQATKGTAQAATQAAAQAAKATSQEAAKQTSQQAAKQAASQQAASKAVSQAAAPAKAVSQAPAKATQAAAATGAAGTAAATGAATAAAAPAALRNALFGGGVGSGGGVEPGYGVGNPSANLYNDTLETQARSGVGGTIYYA